MDAALVLAGGAARRLGGVDKPSRTVGGVTLLDRVLAVIAGAGTRIVVGPPGCALPDGVRRTQEQPPGGGPVAAIAAGLRLVGPDADRVAVLAADLPFLDAGAVAALGESLDGHDAAVLVDDGGRPQWLCALWQVEPLRRRLQELGDPAGQSLRRLAEGRLIARIQHRRSPPVWFDCDTEEDLRRAEEWIDGRAG